MILCITVVSTGNNKSNEKGREDMSKQKDILRANLQKVDQFMEQMINELKVFKSYGEDTEPLEYLYTAFREIIDDMLKAPSPRHFHDMMMQLASSIVAVVVTVSPGKEGKMKSQAAKVDPNLDMKDFDDLINKIKKDFKAKQQRSKKAAENEEVDLSDDAEDLDDDLEPVDDSEEIQNDPNEVVEMLDLGNHVKKKPDPLNDIYKRFE